MLNVPAFHDDMNLLAGKGYATLLEILYDKTDVDPANWLYFRATKYSQAVTFTLPQLGHPSTNVTVTFQPFTMGDFEVNQTTQGQIPGFDLTVENVGREMMSILENYPIERAKGRLIIVHPDKLTDSSARIEEKFSIYSASATKQAATITCVAVSFDPLKLMIPSRVVTRAEFPTIGGDDGRFVGTLGA